MTSSSIGVIEILFVVGTAIYRMIEEIRNDKKQIVFHLLSGFVLFALLNYLGFSIKLNFINGMLITFMGVPGIVLIVVLKLLWMMI